MVAGAVTAVAAVGLAFAPGAAADPSVPPPPFATTPMITTATPFAVVPPVGQTVTVRGTDKLTVYMSPSTACTQSMSVYTPQTSGGYVWADYTMSASA